MSLIYCVYLTKTSRIQMKIFKLRRFNQIFFDSFQKRKKLLGICNKGQGLRRVIFGPMKSHNVIERKNLTSCYFSNLCLTSVSNMHLHTGSIQASCGVTPTCLLLRLSCFHQMQVWNSKQHSDILLEKYPVFKEVRRRVMSQSIFSETTIY